MKRNTVILLVLLWVFSAATFAVQAQEPLDGRRAVERVVIDPGHGGSDRGVVGPGGWTEAQLAVALALQLQEELKNELGLHVVLTRDEGQNPSLAERTAMANGLKADLFLSLHTAAKPYGKRFGYSLFVHDYSRQAGLAGREPSTDLMPGQPGEWALAQNVHLPSSMDLARELDVALGEVLRVRSRGPQKMPLAVLSGAAMPAVLIEVGVLTDAESERRLRTQGYRDALTRAFVHGLETWMKKAAESPDIQP